MRVLILGADGYLGWPTAMHLANKGWKVGLVDGMQKRKWEAEVGVAPLVPIKPFHERIKLWNSITDKAQMEYWVCDISYNSKALYHILETFQPDAIVHYAEQPSAPYSMMNAAACMETQRNNVLGTISLIMACLHLDRRPHIVKLGTMGEYGTPNIDIEEGWLDIEHKGRTDRVLYPKRPNSWYHLSKVHDSHNLEFATRTWGLQCTDLNQGIVYGTGTPETWLDKSLGTSFHYDSIFGTVLNRFLVQAISNIPLTIYGAGTQIRAFLNIQDTLSCVELAIENPPEDGEFRVMNQFTEEFSIKKLAHIIAQAAVDIGITTSIAYIENPRVEQEEHYYNATHTALTDLGLKPQILSQNVLRSMLQEVRKYKDSVNVDTIQPTIKWRQ